MLGISRCASDITALSKVARPPQTKPKELDSTELALGSFACAPLAHLTLPPQDSCTLRPRMHALAPVRSPALSAPARRGNHQSLAPTHSAQSSQDYATRKTNIRDSSHNKVPAHSNVAQIAKAMTNAGHSGPRGRVSSSLTTETCVWSRSAKGIAIFILEPG